jgi:hypothetical protein
VAGKGKKENTHMVLGSKPARNRYAVDDVDGRVILLLILNKHDGRLRIGLILLRIGTSDLFF